MPILTVSGFQGAKLPQPIEDCYIDRPTVPNKSPKPLVEATGWIRHPDGTIELVAHVPGSQWQFQSQCQSESAI